MSALATATVLDVHHWTDRLFSFTCTRDPSFRFRSGQFTMLGLEVEGRPLLRAYSIASPEYADTLEFLSIKIENGPLTSRLRDIQPGDQVLVGRKPTGTLVTDYLLPGRNLYLLGTGTGLAPYLSIIRDPSTYEQFEKVVVVHGTREVKELAYRDMIAGELADDEYIGELVRAQLLYYPTVTREKFVHEGRITSLIESGKLFDDLGLAPLDAERDRVMICGSPEMLADLRALVEARGFVEGNTSVPGAYVIEKAFVEH